MSRIGRLAIPIPAGVTVEVEGSHVAVKGPKGTLERDLSPELRIVKDDGSVRVERPNDEKRARELHGLTRTLLNNMVIGVTEGFRKPLEITGVGYRAQLVVNNGVRDSQPDSVIVTVRNTPPVANAGTDQIGAIGQTVHLDGTASSDVDGDPLTFQWNFTSRPRGSRATLTSPTSAQPTFLVDRPGRYIVRLVTRDGRMRRWDGFIAVGAGAAAAERLLRANRLAELADQDVKIGRKLVLSAGKGV